MDVCCLNRPFDDLSQDRVYLEAEAILSIISRCEKGDWTLISSGAIDYELSKIQDMDRLEQVHKIYAVAKERAILPTDIKQRIINLQQHGIKHFDSLHVATAEAFNADVLLTTDDRFIKAANRTKLSVRVTNPIQLLIGG